MSGEVRHPLLERTRAPHRIYDDVAEIDADAQLDPVVLWNVFIAPCQRSLDLDGALGGIYCARKLDQHAISGGLDDATIGSPMEGSISSLRCAVSVASVPSSSSPISRE